MLALSVTQKLRCSRDVRLVALYKCYMPLCLCLTEDIKIKFTKKIK